MVAEPVTYEWECNEEFDFITDIQRIATEEAELGVWGFGGSTTEEFIAHCKQYCEVDLREQNCRIFFYQKHPTIHQCGFFTEYGTLRDDNHDEGMICELIQTSDESGDSIQNNKKC